MKHLIDKDALVAEIERRKQVAFGWMETAPNDAIEAEFELCDDILSFINSLEVKEVDLDWENVRELCVLSAVVELEKGRSLTDQEHYTEVIKRFKAQKKE